MGLNKEPDPLNRLALVVSVGGAISSSAIHLLFLLRSVAYWLEYIAFGAAIGSAMMGLVASLVIMRYRRTLAISAGAVCLSLLMWQLL